MADNNAISKSAESFEIQLSKTSFRKVESKNDAFLLISPNKKEIAKYERMLDQSTLSKISLQDFEEPVSETPTLTKISKQTKNWRKPDFTSDDEPRSKHVSPSPDANQSIISNAKILNDENEAEKSSVESGEITSESDFEELKSDFATIKSSKRLSVSSSTSSLSFTSSLDSFGRQKRKRRSVKHRTKSTMSDTSGLLPKPNKNVDKKPKFEEDSESSSLDAILKEHPSSGDEKSRLHQSQGPIHRYNNPTKTNNYERHHYHQQKRASEERPHRRPGHPYGNRQSDNRSFQEFHQQQLFNKRLRISEEPEGEYERELRRYRDRLREAKREYLVLCKKEQKSDCRASESRKDGVETLKDSKSVSENVSDSFKLSDGELLDLSSLDSSSDEDPLTEEQKRLERLRRWRSKAEQTAKTNKAES